MTLAERLTAAAAQAVADAKYAGVKRTPRFQGPTHIDARYGRAAAVAVLDVLDQLIEGAGITEALISRNNLRELIHEIEEGAQ